MTASQKVNSPNFGFLTQHDPLLVHLAALAERYVFDDPNSAILKLRQFSEALARQAAANTGIAVSPQDSQLDVLRALVDRRILTPEVDKLFHTIRRTGNAAAHDFAGSAREALYNLQLARKLAIWFHRTFKDPQFRAGPFLPPPNPEDASNALLSELESLRTRLAIHEVEAKTAKESAAVEAQRREEAEAKAQRAYTDLAVALDLAQESEEKLEAERKRFDDQVQKVQTEAAAKPRAQIETIVQQAQAASSQLDLSEMETRKLIDRDMAKAGWEVDSETLRYELGTRPQKGRNVAIAEWPTQSGPADYALFVGLQCLGIVEAKKKNKDVSDAIRQAKRYSKGYKASTEEVPNGGPWGEYRIPFLFSANGRPFLRQMKEKSGIWFLDARRKTNHARALEAWYSPEGLLALSSVDVDESERKLKSESTDYLPLRDYQMIAVEKIEQAIADGQRDLLVAMATGTGKTITSISLIYRFIKANRFRRVLFLVDRTPLGEQAFEKLQTERLENLQPFTEIYDVKILGDLKPDPDTKLHIATVQGMVYRLLYQDEPLPVDQYDCIVVDECHRGYNLDREMTEGELAFRSEAEYISKFRRVLDHFDAVKIGLTATPALHTVEIFGEPVFQYGYRQAVIDGYLVDHEPPVLIKTNLSTDGIHYKRGEAVEIYKTRTGTVDLIHAPDDIDFEIENFNRLVITENFNRVVCRELAPRIDPALPGKTLIFCVTDEHATLVVRLLKEEFEEVYGEIDDDSVAKITGASDKYMELVRRFKNEKLPSVAVTVDLLTTGIDVHEITSIVFLRRVRSRILYDQMIGRATRLRPDLYGPGNPKQAFKIFDAVGLYEALQDYTEMRPVVQNPKITITQLVQELQSVKDSGFLDDVKDQLLAKLQRKRRSMGDESREAFQLLTRMSLETLIELAHTWTPLEIADWFTAHPQIASFLDERPVSVEGMRIISHHDDGIREVDPHFGAFKKPEDYIESFSNYLRSHMNEIPALLVVTQRPRDLTRKQLKELKLALDLAGFSETSLQVAFRSARNQDIAASIIGYIRQCALGSPLIPYDERVSRAVRKILGSRKWTDAQRNWLERIGKQLTKETVIDRDVLDQGAFSNFGGFNRLNKIFDGQLETVLKEFSEQMWNEGA